MVRLTLAIKTKNAIKQKLENIYIGLYTGFYPKRAKFKKIPANHLQFLG